MINLLSAGMYRMLRSRFFYVAIAASILLECYTLLPQRDQIRALFIPMEKAVFTYPLFVVLIVPAFCGLFFGEEYSSGTLRNKLIAGISREKVYCANLLLTMFLSLLLCIAAGLTGLGLGLLFQGQFDKEPVMVFQYFLCSLGIALTISAFSVAVTMLIPNKAVGLVVGVMASLALLFVGQFLFQILQEPPFIQPTERVEENGVVSYLIDGEAPEGPNPYYPRGIQRKVYQFLFYFLPQGQCFQVAFLGIERFWLCMGGSGLFVLLSTAFGLGVFRKKDMR